MPTNQNAALNQRQINVKEPVLLQGLDWFSYSFESSERWAAKINLFEFLEFSGDFRKVSGISSEIFRQIEAVENDHDSSTAAALEVS